MARRPASTILVIGIICGGWLLLSAYEAEGSAFFVRVTSLTHIASILSA